MIIVPVSLSVSGSISDPTHLLTCFRSFSEGPCLVTCVRGDVGEKWSVLCDRILVHVIRKNESLHLADYVLLPPSLEIVEFCLLLVSLMVEWSKAHVSCILLLGYQGFEPWFQLEPLIAE